MKKDNLFSGCLFSFHYLFASWNGYGKMRGNDGFLKGACV